MIAAVGTDSDVPEDCAIPDFGVPNTYELPKNCGSDFRKLVEQHKTLFGTIPGKLHLIATTFQQRVHPFVYRLDISLGTIVRKLR